MALGYDKNHVKFNSFGKKHEIPPTSENFGHPDFVCAWRWDCFLREFDGYTSGEVR